MKTIMKKIISGILIVASLLLCLCGCSLLDKFICTDSNTETPDNNEVVQFAGTPVANGSDMIKAIVDYFYHHRIEYDMPSSGLKTKLSYIDRHNSRLFKITFAPFEYYFLCGYDNQETPISGFDRDTIAKKCHWFIFESEDQIPEYYNGEKCVFAFQFNKADSVIDLLYDDTTPAVEHFLEYTPQFKDGFNVASPLAFGKTIYYVDIPGMNDSFDYSAEKVSYYSTASVFNPWLTLITMEIDGADCVRISRWRNSDGEIYSLESMLGEYYDVVVQEARLDEFQLSLTDNNTFIITLITMDNFVKAAKAIASQK